METKSEKLKIIDFDRKGNVVRFYMGDANLQDWYGDDWNDTPYEHNAGTVYEEFIKSTIDVAFPFNCHVVEPCDGELNSHYCKDDMRERRVPMLMIAKEKEDGWDFRDSFRDFVGDENALSIYMGDSIKVLEDQSEIEIERLTRKVSINFNGENDK